MKNKSKNLNNNVGSLTKNHVFRQFAKKNLDESVKNAMYNSRKLPICVCVCVCCGKKAELILCDWFSLRTGSGWAHCKYWNGQWWKLECVKMSWRMWSIELKCCASASVWIPVYYPMSLHLNSKSVNVMLCCIVHAIDCNRFLCVLTHIRKNSNLYAKKSQY